MPKIDYVPDNDESIEEPHLNYHTMDNRQAARKTYNRPK